MSCRKTMVRLAKDYLAYRRKLGFELKSAGPLLLQFARYADRRGHRGPLTSQLAIRWAKLPHAAARVHWARRLDIIRGFAKHRVIFDAATEIPPKNVFGPAYRRVTPHIYSAAEISALLAAARRLPSTDGLRSHTYATIFGLLACTGLRLKEALCLNRADVDLTRGVLTIRESKFRKSRLVPLHPTTIRALSNYTKLRDRCHPCGQPDAFFLSIRGKRLCHQTVIAVFLALRKHLPWRSRGGHPAPRIHDLRHTFACRCLVLWHKQNADIEHRLAALSTYLGHTSVANTYWYLTGVPELLQLAGARFERSTTTNTGDLT